MNFFQRPKTLRCLDSVRPRYAADIERTIGFRSIRVLIYTRVYLRAPLSIHLSVSPSIPSVLSGCRWRLMQCRKLIGFIGAGNNILQGRAGSFSLAGSRPVNRSYRLAPYFPSLHPSPPIPHSSPFFVFFHVSSPLIVYRVALLRSVFAADTYIPHRPSACNLVKKLSRVLSRPALMDNRLLLAAVCSATGLNGRGMLCYLRYRLMYRLTDSTVVLFVSKIFEDFSRWKRR